MGAVSDYAPTCELAVPGVGEPGAPGIYLVAANGKVEAGPFPSRNAARRARSWLWQHGRGVNPGPWRLEHSRRGLVIGTRFRESRPAPAGQPPGERVT